MIQSHKTKGMERDTIFPLGYSFFTGTQTGFFFQIGSYYLNSGGEGRPTLQNFGADSVTQNIVFWLYNNHHRFIECKIKNMWAQNSVRFFIISYYFYISCT